MTSPRWASAIRDVARRRIQCAHAWASLLILSSALVLAVSANAQEQVDERDRNAARHLALEGAELFDAGQYELAADRFGRAHSLFPAPTLASWHARCLERQGHWLAAEERYMVAANWKLEVDAAVAFHEAVKTAQRELNELRSRIPEIRVVVGGDTSRPFVLRLDGREVPAALVAVHQPVDPGHHTVEAWVEGELSAKVEADVSPLEKRNVIVNIPSAQQAAGVGARPSEPVGRDETRDSGQGWQMPVAIGGFGVGAIGLGLGVWQGLVATSKHSELEDECGGVGCTSSQLDDFRGARSASTIGYVVAGLGIATGAATLLFFGDSDGAGDLARPASVEPWFGWRSAGVRGNF